MAYQWYVAVIDHRPGGQGEQDVSDYYNSARSRLSWGAQGKTDQSIICLELDRPVFFSIPSKAEVIAGWRDPISRQYNPRKRVYGGFLIEKKSYAEGSKHLLDLTIKGYGILPDEKVIQSWPTLDPEAQPKVSYPLDFSTMQWIAGRQDGATGIPAPYDGLIPTYYPTVDTSGIAAVFSDVLMTADVMPGIPNPEDENQFGVFGFCTLKAALDELCKAAHFKDDAIRPMLYWDASTDRQTVFPRVNLIDLNSQFSSEIIATVVSTPNVQAGQILIAEPFDHTRDARQAQQAIIVKGVGSDTTLALLANGTYPLNYARITVADHVNEYPNPYAVDGTWDLLLNVQDFGTVDECTRYGQQVETQVWGARGALTFDVWEVDLLAVSMTLDDLIIGKRVRYIDTMEGIDFVYPITSIETTDNLGAPKVTMTIGLQSLDIADLTIRGSREMPWLRTGESAIAYATREANGVPPPTAPNRAPSATAQNAIKARSKEVTPWTVVGTRNARPSVAPDDVATVPRANLANVTPAADVATDPTPDPNFFVSGDVTGGPGPQEYHFISPKSGKGPLIFRAFTAKHVTVEGTGSVVVNRTGPSGTTASSTLTGTGAVAGDHFTLSPTITFARGDKLTLTVTGTVATALVSA